MRAGLSVFYAMKIDMATPTERMQGIHCLVVVIIRAVVMVSFAGVPTYFTWVFRGILYFAFVDRLKQALFAFDSLCACPAFVIIHIIIPFVRFVFCG